MNKNTNFPNKNLAMADQTYPSSVYQLFVKISEALAFLIMVRQQSLLQWYFTKHEKRQNCTNISPKIVNISCKHGGLVPGLLVDYQEALAITTEASRNTAYVWHSTCPAPEQTHWARLKNKDYF